MKWVQGDLTAGLLILGGAAAGAGVTALADDAVRRGGEVGPAAGATFQIHVHPQPAAPGHAHVHFRHAPTLSPEEMRERAERARELVEAARERRDRIRGMREDRESLLDGRARLRQDLRVRGIRMDRVRELRELERAVAELERQKKRQATGR